VNEFISNTAQIKDAIITNAKITTLDVSKLTAGTITSKTITLAVADGTGDVYIASGKTDFTNVQSGFILGIDDSDSNKAKLYIGDASNYLNWDGTSLTILGTINGIVKSLYPFTTGEDIAAGDAVCLGGLSTTKLTITGASPSSKDFGRITDVEYWAQSISGITGKINEIKVYLSKHGSPTDDVIIYLVADNGGTPTGATLLTFPVIAGTSLTTTPTQYTFTLNGGYDITGATVWVLFSRTTLNNTNYYFVTGQGSVYAGGTGANRYGGVWANQTSDLYMVVNYSPVANLIYKASALEALTTTTFLGFASAIATAGTSCNVQISDILTTTGLTTGSIYYLSNTYGAIATSAGTVSKKVGLAISSTQLNVLNII